MRPLKLTLSAFGPFKKETVIDLEKLGTEGLYLICGDTGAGKTTIFDGIAYALYGAASGDTRAADMFRSEYAAEDTPTFAELVFLFDGKEYTVKRSPAYRKPKKRGGGYTNALPCAELRLPDGSVKSGVTTVTNEIKDLLGLDREQFSQIAMIAQGEFLKMLLASTDDRGALLSMLLKTKLYQTLQARLKEEAAACERECGKQREALLQYINGVEQIEGAPRAALDEAAAASPAAVLKTVKEIIEADAENVRRLAAETAAAEEEAARLNAARTRAEARKMTEENLRAAKKRLEEREATLSRLTAALEAEEARAGERQALSAEIAALEAELPSYDELEERRAIHEAEKAKVAADKRAFAKQREELKKMTEASEALKNEQLAVKDAPSKKAAFEAEFAAASARRDEAAAIKESAERLLKLKEELTAGKNSWEARRKAHEKEEKERARQLAAEKEALEELKKEAAQAAGAELALERAENRKREAENAAAQLLAFEARLDKYAACGDALEKAQKQVRQAQNAYEAANEKYSGKNIKFLSAQAGLLAAKLTQGAPCPVCGSPVHPAPAALAPEVPTEAELKRAKDHAEKAEKEYRALSEAAAFAKSEKEAAAEELLKNSAALFGETEMRDIRAAFAKRREENERELALVQAAVEAAAADVKNKGKLAESLASMEQALAAREEEARLFTADWLDASSAARSEMDRLAGMAENAAAALTEKAQKAYGEPDPAKALSRASAEVKKTDERIRALRQNITVEDVNVRRRALLESLIPQKEAEKDKAREALHARETAAAEAESSLAARLENLQASAAKLKFGDKKSARSAIEKKTEALESSQKRLAAARGEAEKGRAARDAAAGEITGLEKELQNSAPEDMDKISRELSAALERKAFAANRKDESASRLRANRKAAEAIEATASLMAEAERKRALIAPLADTANGTLPQKPRIMLETYVQTAYFDRILERANLRLMIMSNAHYELKRREDDGTLKSKIGLDLDVVDHYNGSRRSVKTLSGGEAFMASLSLALGLSDEIQQKTGGVRLDTLFVDEGFGSLDEESLESALKVLCALSGCGRLVGIISHVAELREKIDRQIVVTKDRAAGSAVRIN